MYKFAVAMVTLAAIPLLMVSGCGAKTAPTASLSESEVEKFASSLLKKEIGVKPDKIDCPGEMPLKVGEEMRCTLTHENDSTGMTVAVDEVDGSDFHLDVEVDEKGSTVAKSDLEGAIADKLEKQTGDRPARVECPGVIQPSVGVTVECVLSGAGGERYGTTITVTENDGTNFKFTIQVDSKPM